MVLLSIQFKPEIDHGTKGWTFNRVEAIGALLPNHSCEDFLKLPIDAVFFKDEGF